MTPALTGASLHRRRLASLAAVALSLGVLSACESDPGTSCEQSDAVGGAGDSTVAHAPRVVVRSNVRKAARDVPVDTLLEVGADHGDLLGVEVSTAQGRLPGRRRGDGTWPADERLEPGTAYVVRARVSGPDGSQVRERRFSTVELSLAQQTCASVAPLAGETVGVGMPVVVQFDLPVTDRAAMEREMHIEATPTQIGSWDWLSDTEVH